jgi:WD40 repeat protein
VKRYAPALPVQFWLTVAMAAGIMGNASSAEPQRNSLSSILGIFSSKESNMVATKIAEFHEEDDVATVEFSPDGRQLAVAMYTSLETHLWVWQGNAHVVRTFTKPHGSADLGRCNVVFSPNGQQLAVAHGISRDVDGHAVMTLFDVNSGAAVRRISEARAGGSPNWVAFSPDGKLFFRTMNRVAWVPGNQFIVHSTDTWDPLWGLHTAPLSPSVLAVSRDARTAVVGGTIEAPGVEEQTQLLVIDLSARAVVRTIQAFPKPHDLGALAWSPDGVHVADRRFRRGGESV